MVSAQTLSPAEVEELGLSNIIHEGEMEAMDNPLVEAMMKRGAAPTTDKAGRPILSYRQYIEVKKSGARMDNYAMLMRWPGKSVVQPMQASKFLKYLGMGYIPVGVSEKDLLGFSDDLKEKYAYDAEVRGLTYSKPARKTESVDNEVTIYRCSDKYPDCERFFDRVRGLSWHWKKDHSEEKLGK